MDAIASGNDKASAAQPGVFRGTCGAASQLSDSLSSFSPTETFADDSNANVARTEPTNWVLDTNTVVAL